MGELGFDRYVFQMAANSNSGSRVCVKSDSLFPRIEQLKLTLHQPCRIHFIQSFGNHSSRNSVRFASPAPANPFRCVLFSQLLLKECHDGDFSSGKPVSRLFRFLSEAPIQPFDQQAVSIGLDHPWMDVALAANSLRIKILGDPLSNHRQGFGEGQYPLELILVPTFRQRWWYRCCFLPLVSRPVACRWPSCLGQIHTFVQAGGIASDSILRRLAGSRITLPSAPT